MRDNLARRFWSYLYLVEGYIRLNLRAQLEYRGAFASQVLGMFLNDAVWVVFWVLFFTRFPQGLGNGGWQAHDVITLWALAATGFGLAHALFGNLNVAELIAQGQLDVWMLYPRSLLSHLLLGRMSATAWGDVLFGLIVYGVFARPDADRLVWFGALSLSVALVFVGFSVLSGSLGFYLSNASILAQQWQGALLSFSTYPDVLFEGGVKVLLYTLIPAGFVTYLPVHALRSLSVPDALQAAGGAAGILALATAVFHHGLRRYESGNLMEMRG